MTNDPKRGMYYWLWLIQSVLTKPSDVSTWWKNESCTHRDEPSPSSTSLKTTFITLVGHADLPLSSSDGIIPPLCLMYLLLDVRKSSLSTVLWSFFFFFFASQQNFAIQSEDGKMRSEVHCREESTYPHLFTFASRTSRLHSFFSPLRPPA